MRTRLFCLSLITMLGVASLANADPITIPPALAPGSTYFLAFVTAGTRGAASSNIADYDAFVTAEANSDPFLASLGTTWKVIGSTATVNAITHIGVMTGPIYNLSGQLVATGSLDMFDGALNAPININQHGNPVSPYPFNLTYVWTGTLSTGFAHPVYSLGSLTGTTILGTHTNTDSAWIDTGLVGTQGLQLGTYGISGPLVVPTAVPEPSTISLMLGALLLLRGRQRRWRHRPVTPTV